MDEETWSYEHKLLFNGLLFCALRSHDNVDEKLLNIKEFIENGADINAQDFNDKCNTPLHIAVKLGEPEIVKFILHNAANCNTKNQDFYTPVELAKISHNKLKHEVITVLETFSNEMLVKNEKHKQKTEDDIIVYKKEEQDIKEPFTEDNTEKPDSKIEKIKQNNKESYLKNENRSGSAGIGGHLFETKLLGLLLHRATIDSDIDDFDLGGNVSGLGAFDDIVFKYSLKNEKSPKYIFVQAKHKENPENQEYISDQSITNVNSNNVFNLAKFFQSYLSVQKKFNKKSENKTFRSDFKNVDCKFIIYTSAFEKFNKKKLVDIQGKEKLLVTADKGKTFMYNYDDSDLEILLRQTFLATAKSLATSFATYIAKSKKSKKNKIMMFDDLIRIYHVYLADNVVNIEKNENNEIYNFGSFRNSFLNSSDYICVLMKETIIKVLTRFDCLDNLNSMKFNLPKAFGNSNISFDSDYEKRVEKLLEIRSCSKNTIEDNNISGKLDKKDIKLIGDLVGSVFILDKVTDLLKINTESSADKIKDFIHKFNDLEYLKKLRFNITIHSFPQLSLIQHQKKVMKDFLDKIIFFTNQATEDKVEVILKKELGELYNSEVNDKFFHLKVDAIYLFYHDSIQKWWKDSKKTNEFLKRSCQFYLDAIKSIVHMPLVNVLSYLYVQKLDDRKLNFEEETLTLLKLQEFMTESGRCLSIVTKDKFLTSIKVNIFFQHYLKTNNYKFICSEDIVQKAIFDIILSEITEMNFTIILVLHDSTTSYSSQMVYDMIIDNSNTNNNKIIVITSNKYILKNSCEIIDNNNRLCDLDENIRHNINQHNTIIYQGYRVPFKCIVDIKLHSLIKEETLLKVMENKSIEIGKKIADTNKTKDIYIKRRLCRCLILSKVKYTKEFHVLNKNGVASARNYRDILIISDDGKVFEKNVKKHPDKNIHWFKNNSEKQIHWIRSHGSIQKLVPLVKKASCNDKNCYIEPQTLIDLSDRVVIISADPGMGKSTTLTHLSHETKLIDKSMCVIRLNLIELESDFLSWQQCNSNSKLIWLLQILYKSFCNSDNKFLTSCSLPMEKQVISYVTKVYGNRVILAKDIPTDLEVQLDFVELQVFFNAYNDDKIALAIDGFDEICPTFKTECIEIFKLLITSRVKYLWISTRYSLNLHELEIELNTFSFSMIGFSQDEQIEFLQKFWKNHLDEYFSFIHPRPIETIKMIAEQFFNAVSYKIKDDQKYFSSIPLHLNMIAEVYKQHFSNYLLQTEGPQFSEILYDAFNLISLYEKFIDFKFDKIRLSQINDSSNFNDSVDRTNKLAARKSFVEYYKKLAADSILPKKTLILSKHDLKSVIPELKRSFHLGEEKTGIVMLTQGKLEFVHRTFAEYFACEFLYDQVKGGTRRAWEYFINHILVMEDEGIRRFIDAKLEKDQTLSNCTSKNICDAILKQTDSKKSALYVAVIEGRINIVTFLLKNMEEHMEIKQLDDLLTLLKKRFKYRCTLCEIYDRNLKSAMRMTMEIIKRVDQNKLVNLFFCEDNPACNIFIIAFLFHDTSSCTEIVDILLSYTKSADTIKLLLQQAPRVYLTKRAHNDFYSCPLLHVLVQFIDKTQIYKYLENLTPRQLLAVLLARDDMGRTAAHWAAIYSNREFFNVMIKIVKAESLKKICTTKDKHGTIPLGYFSFIPGYIDWYKSLCAKIGIGIEFKKGGGWYLYDIKNPETIW